MILADKDNTIVYDENNVNVELIFCGCMYKSPDLYIKYGQSIKSKYDFYRFPNIEKKNKKFKSIIIKISP